MDVGGVVEEDSEEGVDVEGGVVPNAREMIALSSPSRTEKIEYHPSFNFPSDIYGKMKQADRDQLKRQ